MPNLCSVEESLDENQIMETFLAAAGAVEFSRQYSDCLSLSAGTAQVVAEEREFSPRGFRPSSTLFSSF